MDLGLVQWSTPTRWAPPATPPLWSVLIRDIQVTRGSLRSGLCPAGLCPAGALREPCPPAALCALQAPVPASRQCLGREREGQLAWVLFCCVLAAARAQGQATGR